MAFHQLVGIVAGAIAFLAYPAYVWNIYYGTARPNRVTWWILRLASTILAASYWAEGASSTLWIALAYAGGSLAIAVASLTHGEGKWTLLDKLCLAAAVLSALAWWFLQQPLIALLVNIFIDFIGTIPTIYKSYKKPLTESRLSWGMDAVAAILNIFALTDWRFSIVVYPLYLLIVNCLIAYFVLWDRARRGVVKHLSP